MLCIHLIWVAACHGKKQTPKLNLFVSWGTIVSLGLWEHEIASLLCHRLMGERIGREQGNKHRSM